MEMISRRLFHCKKSREGGPLFPVRSSKKTMEHFLTETCRPFIHDLLVPAFLLWVAAKLNAKHKPKRKRKTRRKSTR